MILQETKIRLITFCGKIKYEMSEKLKTYQCLGQIKEVFVHLALGIQGSDISKKW